MPPVDSRRTMASTRGQSSGLTQNSCGERESASISIVNVPATLALGSIRQRSYDIETGVRMCRCTNSGYIRRHNQLMNVWIVAGVEQEPRMKPLLCLMARKR